MGAAAMNTFKVSLSSLSEFFSVEGGSQQELTGGEGQLHP